MKKFLFQGREIKEPKPNAKRYIVLGEIYYSLREASRILKRNLNTILEQSKNGIIYQVKINGKLFIPSWSIPVEKAKSKGLEHITMFKITPIFELSVDESMDGLKHHQYSSLTWDDESIIKILQEYDYEATITKVNIEMKRFVSERIYLFPLLPVFSKPSLFVNEILVKLPYIAEISFYIDQKTWNEQIYKDDTLPEVTEYHLRELKRHVRILDLSNKNSLITKHVFLLDAKNLEGFKKSFLEKEDILKWKSQ